MKFDTLKLLFSMTSFSLLLGLLGMFFFWQQNRMKLCSVGFFEDDYILNSS